jgi:hypothetical protein
MRQCTKFHIAGWTCPSRKREYGHGDPLRWPCLTLYPQKLALTSPTSSGRSDSIVRSRTKAMEFFLVGGCADFLHHFIWSHVSALLRLDHDNLISHIIAAEIHINGQQHHCEMCIKPEVTFSSCYIEIYRRVYKPAWCDKRIVFNITWN